jgi:hypothetical protein
MSGYLAITRLKSGLGLLSRAAALSTKAWSTGRYENAYQKSIQDPEQYWYEKKNLIEWYQEPKVILDRSNSPFDKWLVKKACLIISHRAVFKCLTCTVKINEGIVMDS